MRISYRNIGYRKPTAPRDPNKPPHGEEWPVEMVELLKELALSGVSKAMIANSINGSGRWPNLPKSRNAVLGKLSRLGIAVAKPLHPSGIVVNPRAKFSDWTQPLDKHIRERYAEGLTLKAIADSTNAAFEMTAMDHATIRARLVVLEVYRPRRSTEGLRKPKIQNNSFRQHGAPVAGHLPMIVESAPKTSVHSHDTDGRYQCQWPTSEAAKDMHVCGQTIVEGSYCARHAGIAYRQAPSPRRAALFHKKHEFDY